MSGEPARRTQAPADPTVGLVPGGPAVARGTVWHRRNHPTSHAFSYPVTHAWIDPDRPDELCAAHPLWSATRPAPIRFRRTDYLDGGVGPIGPAVRSLVAPALGHEPAGPVRMLTQLRTWGWLFNPITIYLVWDGPQEPVADADAAVLEVTNTPWKERHHYPLALLPTDGRLTATFDKALHVSPFLDGGYVYSLSIESGPGAAGRRVAVAIDVARPSAPSDPIVETRLAVELRSATRAELGRALRTNPIPTHRVSLGIHTQAARLAAKRVPFIPHPSRQR